MLDRFPLIHTVRQRIRLWIAELWMRVYPNACRANVIMWALFDGYYLTKQRDIPQSCRDDAAIFGKCYCGRITDPNPTGGRDVD